jgi:hypothetical protein
MVHGPIALSGILQASHLILTNLSAVNPSPPPLTNKEVTCIHSTNPYECLCDRLCTGIGNKKYALQAGEELRGQWDVDFDLFAYRLLGFWTTSSACLSSSFIFRTGLKTTQHRAVGMTR